MLEKERGRRYRFFEAIHFPDYHSRQFVKDEQAFSSLTDKYEKEGGIRQ